MSLYNPSRSILKVLSKPTAELTLAGPTLLCDVFNGLLPKNPFAEPNEPVSMADILPTLNKTRPAIIASITLPINSFTPKNNA